eukprot:366370-Chlamydomonas_euryale.AAC.13
MMTRSPASAVRAGCTLERGGGGSRGCGVRGCTLERGASRLTGRGCTLERGGGGPGGVGSEAGYVRPMHGAHAWVCLCGRRVPYIFWFLPRAHPPSPLRKAPASLLRQAPSGRGAPRPTQALATRLDVPSRDDMLRWRKRKAPLGATQAWSPQGRTSSLLAGLCGDR